MAAATWDDWSGFLRPDSTLHFVVVSDDDMGWGLDADEFMQLIAPLSPDVSFHSIVDEVGRLPNCGLFDEPECSCGEERGDTYIELSERTGGLVRSVCDEDWDPIFDALEEAVVEGVGIPCAFDIPELPNGLERDAERLNVEVVEGGEAVPLLNVDDEAGCAGGPGWYYDDPDAPRRVHLCPASCGDAVGEVNVEFGCEIRKR